MDKMPFLVGMTGCTALLAAITAVAQQPAGGEPARDDRRSFNTSKMIVSGRVLLPDGQPAAGAQVAIAGRRRRPSRSGDFSSNDSEILGLAVADDTGSFELETPRASSAEFFNLFALAALDGYARGITPLDCDAQRPTAVVQLGKDDVLRLALIDVQGQPADGVEFFVQRIGIPRPGLVDGVSFRRPPERLALWPQRMKSDDRGRVALGGISRELSVMIYVDDPRFARQWIMLGGTDGANEPTVSLPPSQIIEGTVAYADTGAAAPRARLTVYASQKEHGGGSGVDAAADEHGHFRINPHPGAYMQITAYADDGAPYLASRQSFEWPKGAAKHEINVTLPRGVLAQGKVVDQADQPIAGAAIQYLPLRRNSNRQDSLVFGWDNIGLTDARGEFSLPVLAGEGHLLVQGPNGDFVHQEIGSRVIEDDQPGGQRYYPDAVIRLDVPANKESVSTDVTLRRGVTVRGRLVGPVGEPVHRALIVSRLQLWNFEFYGRSPTELAGDNFELHGLDPEQSYPVMFLDADNEWGATATISGRQAGEQVTVRLAPCGTASARFLGADGKPRSGYRPSLELVVTPGVARYDFDGQRKGLLAFDGDYVANLDRQHYWDGPKTDDMGRITLPALIPGATYRINIKTEFMAETGKNIELGEITLREK
jgi:hypothetical protein